MQVIADTLPAAAIHLAPRHASCASSRYHAISFSRLPAIIFTRSLRSAQLHQALMQADHTSAP